MPNRNDPNPGRALKLYAGGHAALLAGAWAMHATGSMLPLALAASATLMMTVPIVRHLRQSGRRRPVAVRDPGRE